MILRMFLKVYFTSDFIYLFCLEFIHYKLSSMFSTRFDARGYSEIPASFN